MDLMVDNQRMLAELINKAKKKKSDDKTSASLDNSASLKSKDPELEGMMPLFCHQVSK